ncbi:MAG: Gfo/Idh/MocA family oxidoreductase [Pseudomonadota bacterium]|nr:Gfo/Idh/MocA family oxidoreductase [Pseudomonadota bacterium]
MAGEKTCQVAIIGAGYMAGEHIRAFQDIPGVRITGIQSRTKARAEGIAAQFGIAHVCDSIEELYHVTQADLVIVTVPELEMNGVSRACFKYPWVVLLEKPAGYNLADAQEIEVAARSAHSRVFVALNRRHYSSTQAVIEDLQGLSGPRFIRVEDQEDQIRALEAGQPKQVVDNWMYANSIHVIDYFLLMGRGEVSAVEPIVPWHPDLPHFVAAKITFDSGDVGLYESVWNRPGPWAVSVSTPEKRWEMRPLEQAAYQDAGQRKMVCIEPHPWDLQFKAGLRLQAEKAVAATRGEVADLPTLEESLKVMRLVSDIYKPQ